MASDKRIKPLLAVVLYGASAASQAALTAYTDSSEFLAALPGNANTLDFDALSSGTIISSGSTVDGITFDYDLSGVELQVVSDFGTTSAPNYLGTTDGGIFRGGDILDLSFSPTLGLGMFFITADPLFDGDIVLSVGSTSAVLLEGNVETTLDDGSDVYFLGLIDDSDPFATARVESVAADYLFNIDDITTQGESSDSRATEAVPIPLFWQAALFTTILLRYPRLRARCATAARRRSSQGM